MRNRERSRLWGPVIVAWGLFLFHAYRVYGTDVGLIDDAFIFFRYARHWAEGYGLVWNIGGPRVEGVSSLLYTGLLALGIRVGLDVITWATVLNLSIALLTLYLLTRYTKSVTDGWMSPSQQTYILWVPPVLLALSPMWAFWADTGMDTVLLTGILILAGWTTLIAYHRGREASALDWAVPGLAFALLGMTRLDTVPLFVYTLAVITLWPPRPNIRERAMWGMLVGFLGLFVPFSLARWWYFGWPLPNTFYAKMGGGMLAWEEGFRYVLSFLRYPGTWTLIVMAGVGYARFRQWTVGFTAGWVGLLLARAVAAGGDWMPHFRLMVPLLPGLLVLAGLGFLALWDGWNPMRHQVWIRRITVGFLVLLVAWPSLIYVARRPYRMWRPLRLVEPMHASQYAMGVALRKHLCPGDRIALIAAGAAAYLNDDHEIIDMLGLNDLHVAHTPPVLYKGRWDSGHVRLDVDYLLALRPEWIQLDTHLFPTPEYHLRDWMPPQVLWNAPRVRAQYDLYPLRVEVPTDFPRPRVGYIFFLHRKDAPMCP